MSSCRRWSITISVIAVLTSSALAHANPAIELIHTPSEGSHDNLVRLRGIFGAKHVTVSAYLVSKELLDSPTEERSKYWACSIPVPKRSAMIVLPCSLDIPFGAQRITLRARIRYTDRRPETINLDVRPEPRPRNLIFGGRTMAVAYYQAGKPFFDLAGVMQVGPGISLPFDHLRVNTSGHSLHTEQIIIRPRSPVQWAIEGARIDLHEARISSDGDLHVDISIDFPSRSGVLFRNYVANATQPPSQLDNGWTNTLQLRELAINEDLQASQYPITSTEGAWKPHPHRKSSAPDEETIDGLAPEMHFVTPPQSNAKPDRLPIAVRLRHHPVAFVQTGAATINLVSNPIITLSSANSEYLGPASKKSNDSLPIDNQGFLSARYELAEALTLSSHKGLKVQAKQTGDSTSFRTTFPNSSSITKDRVEISEAILSFTESKLSSGSMQASIVMTVAGGCNSTQSIRARGKLQMSTAVGGLHGKVSLCASDTSECSPQPLSWSAFRMDSPTAIYFLPITSGQTLPSTFLLESMNLESMRASSPEEPGIEAGLNFVNLDGARWTETGDTAFTPGNVANLTQLPGVRMMDLVLRPSGIRGLFDSQVSVDVPLITKVHGFEMEFSQIGGIFDQGHLVTSVIDGTVLIPDPGSSRWATAIVATGWNIEDSQCNLTTADVDSRPMELPFWGIHVSPYSVVFSHAPNAQDEQWHLDMTGILTHPRIEDSFTGIVSLKNDGNAVGTVKAWGLPITRIGRETIDGTDDSAEVDDDLMEVPLNDDKEPFTGFYFVPEKISLQSGPADLPFDPEQASRSIARNALGDALKRGLGSLNIKGELHLPFFGASSTTVSMTGSSQWENDYVFFNSPIKVSRHWVDDIILSYDLIYLDQSKTSVDSSGQRRTPTFIGINQDWTLLGLQLPSSAIISAIEMEDGDAVHFNFGQSSYLAFAEHVLSYYQTYSDNVIEDFEIFQGRQFPRSNTLADTFIEALQIVAELQGEATQSVIRDALAAWGDTPDVSTTEQQIRTISIEDSEEAPMLGGLFRASGALGVATTVAGEISHFDIGLIGNVPGFFSEAPLLLHLTRDGLFSLTLKQTNLDMNVYGISSDSAMRLYSSLDRKKLVGQLSLGNLVHPGSVVSIPRTVGELSITATTAHFRGGAVLARDSRSFSGVMVLGNNIPTADIIEGGIVTNQAADLFAEALSNPDVTAVSGIYAAGALVDRWNDLGCPFRVTVGGDIATWALRLLPSRKFRLGARNYGWSAGEAACLFNAAGNVQLAGDLKHSAPLTLTGRVDSAGIVHSLHHELGLSARTFGTYRGNFKLFRLDAGKLR